MIKLNVRLLWDSVELVLATDIPLKGVYAEAWIEIDKEAWEEKLNIEIPEDFMDLNAEIFNIMEVELGEGGLPVGIPICAIMGRPDTVNLIGMDGRNEENEDDGK